MTAEINQRDVARDGMGCIIDRWDGEERQTGLDAEHDQRTALAGDLIDYLIGLGWRRMGDDDLQQAEWNAEPTADCPGCGLSLAEGEPHDCPEETIDEKLDGVPYDDQLMSESEAKHYSCEGGTVLYNDEGKPYRACPSCSGPLSKNESHDGEICGRQDRDDDLDDEETGAIIDRMAREGVGVEPTELEKASPAWAESSRRAAEEEAQADTKAAYSGPLGDERLLTLTSRFATVVLPEPTGDEADGDPDLSISFRVPGLGAACMMDGYGDCFAFEVTNVPGGETEYRLFVWADINSEEPTDIINLAKALETNRRAE